MIFDHPYNYNRTRRHSSLGMLAPIAYESSTPTTPVPPDSCKTGPQSGRQTRWTDDRGPVNRVQGDSGADAREAVASMSPPQDGLVAAGAEDEVRVVDDVVVESPRAGIEKTNVPM